MHGLPLQLSAEEVTLACDEGWAVPRGSVANASLLDTCRTIHTYMHSDAKKKNKRKRWGFVEEDDSDEEVVEEYDNDAYDNDKKPAPWQKALAKGSVFDVPTTPLEASLQQQAPPNVEEEEENDEKATAPPPMHTQPIEWTYPSTEEERHRCLIFKDLHQRGFRITGGSKFGADFLLYPGDPTLYHAQLCVRVLAYDTPLLPAMLASACRGSFQARKHVLLASVVPEEVDDDRSTAAAAVIKYTTFGPVDGFG